jgi:hypothetical protein
MHEAEGCRVNTWIHGRLFSETTDPWLVDKNYGVAIAHIVVKENTLKERSRMNRIGQGGRQEVEDAGTIRGRC